MHSFARARSRTVVSVRTAGLSALILTSLCRGQAGGDLQAIIRDTQRTASVPHQICLVWWLPEQFWRASLEPNNTVSQPQIEKILNVMRRYTLIAGADGRIGPMGGVTYTSEETVRRNTLIKDSKGETYAPFDESALDPDMKSMITLLRPLLSNMLGALGENLHFFVFPSKAKDGRLIADPTKEGTLEVTLNATSFKYRLPLGSVLPPVYDPATGENFPGNYKFNPYTGDKLTESPKKSTPAAK